MPRFKYSGDVNLEHGGYFYTTKDWRYGYASVVRVTPCSDAGAQDNCFWVDNLTVNLPTKDKLREALRCIGLNLDAQGNIVEESRNNVIAKPRTAAYRAAVVEACVAYGVYDQDDSRCISIGKPDPDYDGNEPVEPDVVLRANCSLERHIRRNYLQ